MAQRYTEQELIEHLKLLCKDAGTQNQVADNLGISPQYLSDILNGNRKPSKKILDALGMQKEVLYVANR